MPVSSAMIALDQFTTFGDLLKYLRRRAGLTQLELSIAVGYSDAQISRLEQNERLPDLATLTARFPTRVTCGGSTRSCQTSVGTRGNCPPRGCARYRASTLQGSVLFR